MKTTQKMKRLLDRMAAIERMERGKLCRMTGRTHYNHQTWRNGRNQVHYVPRNQASELQQDIDGYQLFIQLAEQYAEEVIRITHRRRNRIRKLKSRKN